MDMSKSGANPQRATNQTAKSFGWNAPTWIKPVLSLTNGGQCGVSTKMRTNMSNCDIDRWPLCCKKHRAEVEADNMAADQAEESARNGCSMIVLVPHPEPDGPWDTHHPERCGAPITVKVAPSGTKGWECEGGHGGWAYGSPEQMAEELEHEFNERRAEG